MNYNQWHTSENLKAERDKAVALIELIDKKIKSDFRIYDFSKCKNCGGRGGYLGGDYHTVWKNCTYCKSNN